LGNHGTKYSNEVCWLACSYFFFCGLITAFYAAAIRRYDSESIALHGPKGLLARVQEVLDDAKHAGLPAQTAERYYRTFVDLVYED
jgi:hypothetical protein